VSLGRRDLEPIAETEPVYRVFPRIEGDPGGDGKTYSDAIVTRAGYLGTAPANRPELLSRIRPGDIMYYAPGHIAIVRQVVTNEEGVAGDLSDVLLIESLNAGRMRRKFLAVLIASVFSIELVFSVRDLRFRDVRVA